MRSVRAARSATRPRSRGLSSRVRHASADANAVGKFAFKIVQKRGHAQRETLAWYDWWMKWWQHCFGY